MEDENIYYKRWSTSSARGTLRSLKWDKYNEVVEEDWKVFKKSWKTTNEWGTLVSLRWDDGNNCVEEVWEVGGHKMEVEDSSPKPPKPPKKKPPKKDSKGSKKGKKAGKTISGSLKRWMPQRGKGMKNK